MGDAYFVDANYEAAVEAYTESLATKADATSYQRRAAAYLALKKNLKALEDANRAIELESSNYLAFYRKGLAALNLGELEVANSCLTTALSLAKAAKENYLVSTLEQWIDRCTAELEIDDDDEEEEDDDEDEEPEVTEVETPPELPAAKAPVAPAPKAPVPVAAAASAVRGTVKRTKKTVLYRHSFYQMSKTVVLSLFVPEPTPEGTQIQWTEQSLTVTVDRPSSYYHKEFYFFKAIKPELCKVKYLSDKIEFKIKKAVKSKDDWESLEGKKQPVASAAPARASAYSSKKDWNKIDKECAEELEKEPPKGDAALQKLFRDIYSKADDKTRMAMNKSFQTSGGTCLSTNWKEVKEKDYEKEKTAPDGMEWKRWDGSDKDKKP